MTRYLTTETPTAAEQADRRRPIRSPRKPTHADAYEHWPDVIMSVVLTLAILSGMAWGAYHLLRAVAGWVA